MSCYWCSAFRATERCGTGKGVSAHPSPPAADLWWNAYSENRRVLEQRKLGVGLRLPRGFPAGLTADRQTSRCFGSVPSPPPPGKCSAIANFDRNRLDQPHDQPAGPHLRGRPRAISLRHRTRSTGLRGQFAPNPRDRHCATQPARPKPAPDGTRRTARAGPHLRGQPASWLRDEQAAAVDVTTSGRMLANGAADGASASVRHDRPHLTSHPDDTNNPTSARNKECGPVTTRTSDRHRFRHRVPRIATTYRGES